MLRRLIEFLILSLLLLSVVYVEAHAQSQRRELNQLAGNSLTW